jgi:drug/metabolite transporter (DMT)-like permease
MTHLEATNNKAITYKNPLETRETTENRTSLANTAKGCFAVGSIIVIWLFTMEIVDMLAAKMDYKKPFFQRILQQSFLILCLVALAGKMAVAACCTSDAPRRVNVTRPLLLKLSIHAAIFTTLYQLTGYVWYKSLKTHFFQPSPTCFRCRTISIPLTRASTNLALYQSTIVFSYILSVLFLKEKFTTVKSVAVLLTLAGVVVVVYSSKKNAAQNADGKDSLAGMVYDIISALTYSVVQVFYGFKVAPHEFKPSTDFVLLFSGLQGLFSLFFLMPVGCFIFHLTGWETFQAPPLEGWMHLILCSVMYVFYIFFLLLALTWTNASFVGIGTSLIIPLSVLTDWFFHGYLPSSIQLLGILTTLIGAFSYALGFKQAATQKHTESDASIINVEHT